MQRSPEKKQIETKQKLPGEEKKGLSNSDREKSSITAAKGPEIISTEAPTHTNPHARFRKKT